MRALACRVLRFPGPWALLLATALVAPTTVSSAAAAADAAPVLLRGDDDSYVDVDLAGPIRLGSVTEFPAGANGGEQVRSTSLGTASGSYLGWYVLSLPDLRPVTGFLQIRRFDEEFGEPFTFALTDDSASELAAGRYRFVLLTDGAGEARIPTMSLRAPLVLSPRTPHPTAGGTAGAVGSTATTRLHSKPLPFALETGSVFVIAEQRVTSDGEGAGTSQLCFERRDVGCEPVAPRGGSDQLNAGSSGVTRVVDTEAYRPGVWEAEWVSAGAQLLRLFAFAVGPGPRPVPELPEASAAVGVVDPSGQSRDRTVLDACPRGAVPSADYADVAPGAQSEAVNCIAWYGVTRGVAGGGYAPGAPVTRGQMASFLVRVLDRAAVALPAAPADAFPDDDGTTHERASDQLAALGVVGGFADGTYRPAERVRRDQMASFVHRAYAVAAGTPLRPSRVFADSAGNTHDSNISSLADNGIVRGVDGARYGPAEDVSRAQMAFFLTRTLDLLVELGRAQTP